MTKTPSFCDVLIAVHRVLGASKIDLVPQKSALYPMKLARKDKNNEFWDISIAVHKVNGASKIDSGLHNNAL